MPDDNKTNPSAVGERLRWAREQAGLSQAQVARLFGCHRPTISQIEAGQRVVRPDELSRFAKLYSVQESWIINGDAAGTSLEDARVQIAARELAKLSKTDLDAVLKVIRVMRSRGEDRSE